MVLTSPSASWRSHEAAGEAAHAVHGWPEASLIQGIGCRVQ